MSFKFKLFEGKLVTGTTHYHDHVWIHSVRSPDEEDGSHCHARLSHDAFKALPVVELGVLTPEQKDKERLHAGRVLMKGWGYLEVPACGAWPDLTLKNLGFSGYRPANIAYHDDYVDCEECLKIIKEKK